MAVIPVAAAPVDVARIEGHEGRAVRVVRIEGRRPIATAESDFHKAFVVPTTGSRKEYPIIRVTGLL